MTSHFSQGNTLSLSGTRSPCTSPDHLADFITLHSSFRRHAHVWLVPSSSLGGFCANTTLLRCPFLRESLSVSSSGKVASSQSLWEPESCMNFATSSFIMIRNEIICVLFTVYPNRRLVLWGLAFVYLITHSKYPQDLQKCLSHRACLRNTCWRSELITTGITPPVVYSWALTICYALSY